MAPDQKPPDDRSAEIDGLLFEYIDRLNAGEILDPSAIERDHPQIAASLIERLQVYRGLEQPSAGPGPAGTIGDYTLRRQIARGGMGVVYEAWQNSLDRQVALKVLPPGVAADPKSSIRFLREAQIVAKLSHPQIVPVFASGIEAGTPWYAMEFVEGETLAQVLSKLKDAEPEAETPFGKKDIVVYFAKIAEAFAEVADGLQHAHSKGIIHRDIKPSNLILDKSGRLRILDFGLARLEGQESLTITGEFLGTPLYMSPEQARRKKIPVDHRTDVYSLGATLYEFLTLQPPFQGKDHQDTLSQIIERDPVEPTRRNPKVPRDLETIVLKCLRKDAGDRYGTAEALGQDLRRFVRGEVIEARPEGGWERWGRLILHRRRAILTCTLLAVTITCAFGLALLLRQRDSEQRGQRYRRVIEDAILAIELAHGGPVDWEDSPPWARTASDVDEWYGDHQRELLERAVDDLGQLARETPLRPEAHFHAARALSLLRREEEAGRELDAARQRDPGRVLPGIFGNEVREGGDGTSLSERWMRLRSEELPIGERLRGYDELARRFLRQGEPYAGLRLELRIEQGRTALQAGDHLRAVEVFASLHAERPEAYTAALLLARAYYQLGENGQAKRLSDDALRTSERPSEAAAAFSVLHARYGEKGWARETLGAIQDRFLQVRGQVAYFGSNMSREELLALDAELAAALAKGPEVYELRCDLSWNNLDDPHRGVAIAEEGLRLFPRAGGLYEGLGWSLFYSCEFERSIAAFDRGFLVEPSHSRPENGVGFAQYRLGNLEAAEAAFTESLRIYPRLTFPYFGRGKARWLRGDLRGAVDDFVRCLLLAPGHSRAAYCLAQVLGDGGEDLMAPHWAPMEKSLSRALSRQVKYPLLLGLLALCELHVSPSAAPAALDHAEAAVESAEGPAPWIRDCLAQAQQAIGDPRSALMTLEAAREWSEVAPEIPRRLDAFRRSPSGRLLTCSSLDTFLEEANALDPSEKLKLVTQARSSLGERGEASLLSYLESRLALLEGNRERSLALLERAVGPGQMADETAVAKLADLRSEFGRRDEALGLLENRVLAHSASPERWAGWLRIAGEEPALPLGSLLEREVLKAPTTGRRAPSLAGDVRWVLEELAGTGSLRINCGGEEETDRLGQRWGADRFFCSGEGQWETQVFACDASNVVDSTIYRTQRWGHARFGYRIPVPPGRYELTLHFYEVWGKPGGQRFDVTLNGRVLLEGQVVRSPERPHDARVERFEVEASEGILSLVFVPRENYVSVAGIELKAMGR
jgi:tetratricopeptide (TPR) repeat protein